VIDKKNIKSEIYLADDSAVFIKRTLRSGNKLQHPGNVVVLGDVNPGAEIVAGGDIIVWGRLRGVVHAGADGNTNAVICALDLSPAQLRIADKIALTPKRKGKTLPEVARVKDDQLIADVWNSKE
jgi:septum site-determining protein MinC